ncbi:MAG: hypothetical protein KGL39_30080 [Patescibacteria group bacterium]|nr:hypothetical protein [Patescibacteria group bacterium]
MYKIVDIRPGDIIAVHGDDILSAIIETAIVAPYSHLALVGQGHLIEALYHVTRSSLDKYQSSGDVFRVSADGTQVGQAIAAAESKVGQPYGWQMVLEDAGRDLLHLPIHPRLDDKTLDCSGLIYWAWLKAGIVLTHAPVPTPADLVYSPLLLGKRRWE